LSVVELIVPEVAENATVSPPLARLVLLASLACTVSTCVLEPSAVFVAVAGLIVEWLGLTGSSPDARKASNMPAHLLLPPASVADPVPVEPRVVVVPHPAPTVPLAFETDPYKVLSAPSDVVENDPAV